MIRAWRSSAARWSARSCRSSAIAASVFVVVCASAEQGNTSSATTARMPSRTRSDRIAVFSSAGSKCAGGSSDRAGGAMLHVMTSASRRNYIIATPKDDWLRALRNARSSFWNRWIVSSRIFMSTTVQPWPMLPRSPLSRAPTSNGRRQLALGVGDGARTGSRALPLPAHVHCSIWQVAVGVAERGDRPAADPPGIAIGSPSLSSAGVGGGGAGTPCVRSPCRLMSARTTSHTNGITRFMDVFPRLKSDPLD